MSEKEQRMVPVFTDGDGVVSVPLTVEVDGAGEYWLAPEQVEDLHALHVWAQAAWAQWATTASDRLELG